MNSLVAPMGMLWEDKPKYCFILSSTNKKRRIDPKEDVYPPPLMTSQSSEKVTGTFAAVEYALWYYQPQRLAELVLKHQNDFHTITEEDYLISKYATAEQIKKYVATHLYDAYASSDDYVGHGKVDIYTKRGAYGNLMNGILSGSYPTNIGHFCNEFLNDRMLFAILNSLSTEENKREMIGDCLEDPIQINYHCHRYLYVLLNWGAQCTNVPKLINLLQGWYKNTQPNISQDTTSALLNVLQTHLPKIQECKHPNGRKLDYLIDRQPICSITHQTFVEPVLAEDGHVYEKTAILKWFEISNRSPLLNVELPKWWILYEWRKNEFIYADNQRIFSPQQKGMK